MLPCQNLSLLSSSSCPYSCHAFLAHTLSCTSQAALGLVIWLGLGEAGTWWASWCLVGLSETPAGQNRALVPTPVSPACGLPPQLNTLLFSWLAEASQLYVLPAVEPAALSQCPFLVCPRLAIASASCCPSSALGKRQGMLVWQQLNSFIPASDLSNAF